MLRFPECRSMGDDLPELIMADYIQVARNEMSRCLIVERRMGTITFYGVFKYSSKLKFCNVFFVLDRIRCNCMDVIARYNWHNFIFKNTYEYGIPLYDSRCCQD